MPLNIPRLIGSPHPQPDLVAATSPATSGQQATPPRTKCLSSRVAALLTVAALTLTACSSTDDTTTGNPATETPTTSDVSPSASTPPAPPENPTTVAIDNLTGNKTVELTTDTLPAPPAGFNADEVAAFGDRAIDLISRGISPEVAKMGEGEAFNFVFAGQYEASADATREAFESLAGDYSSVWAFASRFQQPPTTPAQVLAARWQVTTSEGQSVDGPAPVLRVVLSVAVEHQVPDTTPGATTGTTVPIVMQRSVIISGFRPLGGPAWYPGIGYQANAFFGGKCALTNGGLLTPATRPSTLKEDLRDLRRYLNKPKQVTPQTSSTSDLEKYVAKYCEDA